MNRYVKAGLVLSLSLFGACDEFIQGPGLTENPNSPTQATALQQLIALQANMATYLEGQLARTAGIYTQQVIGSNNQQLLVTQYQYGESDYSGFFNKIYTGGGMLSARAVQDGGVAAGDKFLEGIGKVWEGIIVGTATSIWGDIPYSEALRADVTTPKLDAQQEVYTAVQKLLDDGIAALQAASTTGACEPNDLVYCASGVTKATEITRWIAAANTLKARFYLDVVERTGNAAYTLALAAAQKGISEVPTSATNAMHGQGPGDFRTFHGATKDVDGNIWAEFLTDRGADIAAGNVMVTILKDRNDPRLSAYFNANTAGAFIGLNENNQLVGAGPASQVNTSVRRLFTFRQPIVTWAENQLIMAEAKFKLTGATDAMPHVNAVRTAVGLPAFDATTFGTAPTGTYCGSAAAAFCHIMLEKYIAMFQNISVWSDFKRTCVPLVKPFGTAAEVPGRIPYGSGERNNNPNIPAVNAYPTGTTGSAPLRNWNDQTACPRPA